MCFQSDDSFIWKICCLAPLCVLNQRANEYKQNKSLFTKKREISLRYFSKRTLKINSTELQIWKDSSLGYFSQILNRTAKSKVSLVSNIDLIWLTYSIPVIWQSCQWSEKKYSHWFVAGTSFWMVGFMGQIVVVKSADFGSR